MVLGMEGRLPLILVDMLAGLMFSSLLIFLSRVWLGEILLTLCIALFATAAIIEGSPFALAYVALLTPSLTAFGLITGLYRRAIERVIGSLEHTPLHRPPLRLADHKITEPEQACLRHLMEGRSTKEIAEMEELSISTINNRLSSIYRKCGVIDRAQLLFQLGQYEVVFQDGVGGGEKPDIPKLRKK
jgi:DNA-binding CsgD family transcriptional regulator